MTERKPKLIVSVHLPKTAGTSFGATLEAVYGDQLIRDYADVPINTPVLERNSTAFLSSLGNLKKDFGGVRCIHGHFLPVKYLLLSGKIQIDFITWLRNPVDRLISHYHYWQRSYRREKSQWLHKKVIEEKWTLERFCLGPELKNIYSQFLYGFPLENFSFIGITEFYNEDYRVFSEHYLESYIESKRLRVGNAVDGRYEIDKSLRSEIEHFHEVDMNLYHRALSLRGLR